MKRSVTQSEAYAEAEAEACLSTYNTLSTSSTYKGRDGEKAKVRSLVDRTKPEPQRVREMPADHEISSP